MNIKNTPSSVLSIRKNAAYSLISRGMGLGKSVIALTAIRHLRYDTFAMRKALVIAPKKVAEGTWMRESQKWDHTSILRLSLVAGPAKKRIQALHTPADVYVIGRDNVVWLVEYYKNNWPFDVVIVDESSSFKSHKAKRFKALAAMFDHIDRCVLLTGTPSPNNLSDLWAQMYLIDKGKRLGTRYTGFRERYFDPDKRGADGMIYSYKAKDGSEESILKQIGDVCVSMRARDYLELPDIVYDTIPVVLDEKAKKKYMELEKKMILELPEDEDEISAMSAAALSVKLLQLANGAVYDEDHVWHHIHDCKLEALLELLESLKERGKQALVFYTYKHDLDRIQTALKGQAMVLKGQQEIDAWNAGKCDVLLAHPASAGYGLNLQEGGNHIIWFGLTWNYEHYTQANARLHRQGQTEKVIVHQLVTEDTRDEDVLQALERKGDIQEWVLESLKARIKKIRGRI